MLKKIATIINDSKTITSFEKGSAINIYYKASESWQLKDEISYSLNMALPLSDIRDYIKTVVLKLEDCKIIIGKTVSGLPYNIFDRMGFAIFEAEAISDALLDEILSEVHDYTNEIVDPSVQLPTSPIQTEIAGLYFLNLIELQEKHPEISSKKALQDFLVTIPFYKLELICSHVPPWLESFLPSKKMTYETGELEKNKYKVTIRHLICND
jgi:Fe-only nitrogenase accessory protein AnfO